MSKSSCARQWKLQQSIIWNQVKYCLIAPVIWLCHIGRPCTSRRVKRARRKTTFYRQNFHFMNFSHNPVLFNGTRINSLAAGSMHISRLHNSSCVLCWCGVVNRAVPCDFVVALRRRYDKTAASKTSQIVFTLTVTFLLRLICHSKNLSEQNFKHMVFVATFGHVLTHKVEDGGCERKGV